jgi:hypothetical protein
MPTVAIIAVSGRKAEEKTHEPKGHANGDRFGFHWSINSIIPFMYSSRLATMLGDGVFSEDSILNGYNMKSGSRPEEPVHAVITKR